MFNIHGAKKEIRMIEKEKLNEKRQKIYKAHTVICKQMPQDVSQECSVNWINILIVL